MKRYFKHEAESDLGAGVAYLEFDGEWAVRQVERYNDRWFCSKKDIIQKLDLLLQINLFLSWSLNLSMKYHQQNLNSCGKRR